MADLFCYFKEKNINEKQIFKEFETIYIKTNKMFKLLHLNILS